MNLLVRSVYAAGLGKRDGTISSITNSISDVKTAFSSWDNCMQATFCKWPVIAIIAIGGLIIFSFLWCIIRCMCCGLSCCCECCYCLKCCGSCCGMCDAPQKRHKYLDEPYVPPHHDQAYRSQDPMFAPQTFHSPVTAKPEPPQYAEFDTGKKGGGDELPQMPSWEGAGSKKVLVEDEQPAVELEQLKKPEAQPSVALMTGAASSHPASPIQMSPQGTNNPYGQQQDPYAMNGNGQGQGYNNYNNGGYGQTSRGDLSQGYGNQGYTDQGYGMAGAAAGAMARRGTPQQDYNNGGYGPRQMNQGYPQSRAQTYDDYGARSGTPSNAGYGMAPPQRSTTDPYAPGPNRMRSPAPPQGYGYDQRSNTPNSYGQQYRPSPQRQYTTDSQAAYPPGPQRQYSNDSQQPLTRPGHEQQYSEHESPISNTGGFDFNSGYSRAENVSRHDSPAPQQTTGGSAYPGYRPYKPQQQQDGGY